MLENSAANVERERERMQKFVDRFRAQANKARAVQSRVKALEKMDEVVTFSRREVMRLQAALDNVEEGVVLLDAHLRPNS